MESNSIKEFFSLLLAENESLNLTSHTEDELNNEVLEDCKQLLQAINPENQSISLIDVGSGGGFPAIPLAIMSNNIHVTSLEPIGKKAAFQKKIQEKLKINNLVVINGRAEELGRDAEHREKFDIVTARAVAHLAVLVELTSCLVKPEGKMLFLKGPGVEEEISRSFPVLKEHGVRVVSKHSYRINGKERIIVEVIKETPSPASLPRSSQAISRLKKKLKL